MRRTRPGPIVGTAISRPPKPSPSGGKNILALPVAETARMFFAQRSENTRIRVSPKCFPGTASRSGSVRRVTVRRMPDEGEARPSGRDRKSEGRLLPHHPPVCPKGLASRRALEGASPAGGSTALRLRRDDHCSSAQSLPRARGRWREAPDEVPAQRIHRP